MKEDNKNHVKDSLVEILLEPELYGIVDVRAERAQVIEKLVEMGCETAESEEVCDLILIGDTQNAIKDYFDRNLAVYCEDCKTLYHRMEDYAHLLHLATGQSPRQLEETLEELEGAMLCMEDLSKALACKNANIFLTL
jgi:hypothetical protein